MNDDSGRYELSNRWGRAVSRNIRWILAGIITILLVVVVLHKAFPPPVAWLGQLIGFEESDAAARLAITSIILIAILLVLDRQIALEEALLRNPQVRTFARRDDAYFQLLDHVREHQVDSIDLLQFSGHTAVPLLKELAKKSPRASVRLLLCHPDAAEAFDADNSINHANRISTTIEEIGLVENEHKHEGFQVEIHYYRTPPSLSSVLVDDAVISMGWYQCFLDPETRVLRLRGHDAPAMNAHGDAARPIVPFLKRQFELRLLASEPARPTTPATRLATGSTGDSPHAARA